ncbi:MAG TPA: ferrochelatase [Flavobacteriales bacterium]|nr:ferrochelatase [Flavobacteriales bacterium]
MSKKGILLINLGTPKSPSKKDVRKYLTQFLNDPRVIDINPIGRFFLVNGIIVPFRSGKSAKLYANIWTKQGSPLLINSLNLQKKLQASLGNDYVVELGMRYQEPSIESAVEKLKASTVDSITAIPLYPQYATSSTTSSIEETNRVFKKWKNHPPVKFIENFFDDKGFIDACVDKAKKYNLSEYDYFIFSYHGLPERQITKASAEFGDGKCQIGTCCNVSSERNRLCYRANSFATTRALVAALNIPEGKYQTTFQSRLNDKWLKPYSDKVVEDLAKEGKKKILVFSPAFVADCLETIYEIGTEYDEIFKHNGGEKVQLVESLNDSDAWVEALKNLVK